MPAIIAFFVRQFIIIVVQLGIFAFAERVIVPLFNKAVAETIKFFGVAEDTAEDILTNEILTTAEALGVTVALSKARLPLKLSEKLGFTSKGFSKRKLAGSVEQAVATAKSGTIPTAGGTGIEATKLADLVSKERGFLSAKVKDFLFLVSIGIGLPTGIAYTLAQYLDYANWPSGAFQQFFKRLFVKLGLPENKVYSKSELVSEDTFKKLLSFYTIQGAVGINDPYKNQSLPFTRDNVVDVIDQAAAQIIAEKGNATFGDVLAALQAFVTFKGPVDVAAAEKAAVSVSITAKAAPLKALTGTLAQGRLGTPQKPEIQEAGLLTNIEELKTSARNALFQFLASVPGRIVYDIKLATSVIDQTGIRRYATKTTQVIGTNTDGTQKTKTLLNRIAIIDVYIVKQGGIRTKIDQIILGPTAAFGLTSGITQLAAVEQELRGELPAIQPPTATSAPEEVKLPVGPKSPAETALERENAAAPAASVYAAGAGGRTVTIAGRTFPLMPIRFFESEDTSPSFHQLIASPSTDGIFGFREISQTRAREILQREPNIAVNGKAYILADNPISDKIEKIPELGFSFVSVETVRQAFGEETARTQTMQPRTVSVNIDALLVRAAPNRAAALAGSQRLVRGDTFIATGWTKGENVDGEDRWWISQFGNYVWVGGTAEKP